MGAYRRWFFRTVETFVVRAIIFLSAAIVGVSYVSQFFEWGNSGPFLYLRNHAQVLWLFALTSTVIVLSLLAWRMYQRFVRGFSDRFKGDPRANWDFEDLWRIPEKGTLFVAGPDEERDASGGITKVGALWENYTFSFKALIINSCLGVVVRAQDLNNYYMFQIQTDQLRPHRRVAIPVLDSDSTAAILGGATNTPLKFKVGWQFFDPPTPLNRQLKDWFSARVVVRGQAISIYIDDKLAFQRDSFLQIPMGKVGFRNGYSEEALVKNVKVVLQT